MINASKKSTPHTASVSSAKKFWTSHHGKRVSIARNLLNFRYEKERMFLGQKMDKAQTQTIPTHGFLLDKPTETNELSFEVSFDSWKWSI